MVDVQPMIPPALLAFLSMLLLVCGILGAVSQFVRFLIHAYIERTGFHDPRLQAVMEKQRIWGMRPSLFALLKSCGCGLALYLWISYIDPEMISRIVESFL